MKNNAIIKKALSLILCMVLIAAVALFATACGGDDQTDTETPTVEKENVIGKGETMFYFVVVDSDKKETSYQVYTDKKTVGEALLEHELIDGEDGPYGLYVKTVNGETVDFDKDGKYWAFYVNGEYATTGVEKTEIKDGDKYSFKVEK